jgi:hypothetical protein
MVIKKTNAARAHLARCMRLLQHDCLFGKLAYDSGQLDIVKRRVGSI